MGSILQEQQSSFLKNPYRNADARIVANARAAADRFQKSYEYRRLTVAFLHVTSIWCPFEPSNWFRLVSVVI
jgi:hypothetical protein